MSAVAVKLATARYTDCRHLTFTFMKHKKIFQKVRKLIDERELDDANLEAARDELFTIVESDAECDWAYGLLSEINYWLGEYATDAGDKISVF